MKTYVIINNICKFALSFKRQRGLGFERQATEAHWVTIDKGCLQK